jgi:hypothetical protein
MRRENSELSALRARRRELVLPRDVWELTEFARCEPSKCAQLAAAMLSVIPFGPFQMKTLCPLQIAAGEGLEEQRPVYP